MVAMFESPLDSEGSGMLDGLPGRSMSLRISLLRSRFVGHQRSASDDRLKAA
jgi:hypothetical protein